MKVYKVILRAVLFLAVFAVDTNTALAQNGDQILDGIGETGMSVRYLFNGDLKDWSRNNLHAKFQGANLQFVNDNRFGKVLSLPGDHNSFVIIPGEALTDIESLSISGWIYLRSKQPGQSFFDVGKDVTKHFFAAPLGTKTQKGFLALIKAKDDNGSVAVSPAIEINKWVFLTIVIDVPSKSMVTYVNGKPVAETKDIPRELIAVFSQQSGEKKLLYIGKSLLPEAPFLNAMVHDFRIYRIPLSSKQVAGIYSNSQKGVQQSTVNVGKSEDNLPHFPQNQAQLYNSYLTQVSDIEVETTLGDLPRLPSYLEGTYKNGMKGPKVRVLWPSPMDNTAVLKPGNYTVTGRVSGTDFQPKAFVTIKALNKEITPVSKLEVFPLDQVSLKTDIDRKSVV